MGLTGEACVFFVAQSAHTASVSTLQLHPSPSCTAGNEEQPAQPGPGEPGYAQLQQLHCLASPVPQEHPAWEAVGDGSQLLVDSFRLSFAECAARGAWEAIGIRDIRGQDARQRLR